MEPCVLVKINSVLGSASLGLEPPVAYGAVEERHQEEAHPVRHPRAHPQRLARVRVRVRARARARARARVRVNARVRDACLTAARAQKPRHGAATRHLVRVEVSVWAWG